MNYKHIEFQNHRLLEIACSAKRGMWFEKFATGSPPRHDAQLRLVNAQQTDLRGAVRMSLYTYHVMCFPVFGSHLHNTCVGNSGECCRGQGPWLCTWVFWLPIGLRTRGVGSRRFGMSNLLWPRARRSLDVVLEVHCLAFAQTLYFASGTFRFQLFGPACPGQDGPMSSETVAGIFSGLCVGARLSRACRHGVVWSAVGWGGVGGPPFLPTQY